MRFDEFSLLFELLLSFLVSSEGCLILLSVGHHEVGCKVEYLDPNVNNFECSKTWNLK